MPFSARLPIIGVPAINDHDAAGVHAPRFSNNQSYLRAVEAAGSVPILIPHIESEEALRQLYEMLDGILLTGGVDIHPRFYGQQPHPSLDPPDIGLDHVETTMLPWAIEDDLRHFERLARLERHRGAHIHEHPPRFPGER